MNAIPLRAPDGAIYAYACGRCFHVASSSAMLVVPDTPGPIAQLVESSQVNAWACCRCFECRTPLTGDRRCGLCDECGRFWDWRRLWTDIGWCLQRGIATAAQYQEALRDTYDGEDE